MWKRIASVREAKAAPISKVSVSGHSIVYGMVGDRPFAFESECPHKGGPLEKGELKGESIRCSWHGYEYNLFNGRVEVMTYPDASPRWRKTTDLRVHRVKVLEGALYVEIS